MSLLKWIYTSWGSKNIQQSILAILNKITYKFKTTTKKYFIRLCQNYAFMSSIHFSSIYGSNIQHSILSFHKENTILLKKKCQGIMPTIMLASLVNLRILVCDVYTGDISHMKCLLHHLQLEKYLIQQKTISKLPTFMLELIRVYFSWYVSVGTGKISNIQC